MPWTINSEIYPLNVRGSCTAIATSVNWLSNLVVSLTFLTLANGIGWGPTFFLYGGMAAVGLVGFCCFLPETRGRSLHEIKELFGGD